MSPVWYSGKVNMIRYALRIDDNGVQSVKDMLGLNKKNNSDQTSDLEKSN